jgi:hypothetical protein
MIKSFSYTYLFAIFILLIAGKSYSQSLLSGQVKDNDTKEPLAYCTATVYNQKDSLIVGAITNDKGFFEIPVAPGSYKLVLSFVGYFSDTSLIQQGTKENFLGIIPLKKNTSELGEVEIKGTTSDFNLDKEVEMVTSKMREGSANTADVLDRVKGVSYDRYNRSIKVDGDENIIILVNGLEKNQEYIKNLSPDRLKEIEIIRNPSGRYALDGYTAIVNVILKNDYRGTELYAENLVMIDPNPDQKKYFPIDVAALTFNYTYDKLNFYVRATNNYTDLSIKHEASQLSNSSLLVENTAIEGNNNMIVNNLFKKYTVGLDYYLNPKHTLSFESNISDFPPLKEAVSYEQQVDVYYDDIHTDSYIQKSMVESLTKEYLNSLFYIYKIDDKSQLNADFSFSHYTDEYLNTTLQSNGYNRYEDGSNAKDYTKLFLEYTRSLNEKASIMAGYGNTWRSIGNFYTTTSEYSSELQFFDTADFSLSETRHKFYAYYSHKLTPKISTKIGAASEYSHPISDYLDKTYFIIQPHADLFINAHQLLAVKLKYRSFTNYPSIQQTNPFARLMSQYIYEKGNPELNPELTHSISAQIKLIQGLLTVEPYYSFSNNHINRTITPLNDSIFEFGYDNVGNYKNKGIKGNITIPLFKQSFIIQSGFNFYDASISYQGKVNSVKDWTMSTQLVYIHKKTEALGGLKHQKEMRKIIHAQGYTNGNNDYWLVFAQMPVLDKKMTVMLGYMLPLDFLVSYEQGTMIDDTYYISTTRTDISFLKNLLLFRVTYRFNKGKSIRDLQKEIESEKEKESNGFF